MAIFVWRPGASRRYTRRYLLGQAGRATALTVVGGSFFDLVAAQRAGGEAAASSASVDGSRDANALLAQDASQAKRGGTLNYGTLGNVDYGSLDMTTTTGTFDLEIALGMQDAYIYLLPDGSFAPGLAESWEVSPDGLAYTFKLRPDIVFHDGTPLNAEAAKYNFDRIIDKERNPSGLSYSYLGAGVSYQGCEVVDEQTIRHTLSKPNALFMYRMRRAYLSPQSPTAIERYGEDYFRNPVSVGPFRFVEWSEGDHVTLEAFDQYTWGPPALFQNTGRPYLDRIVHRIFKDLTTKATALESGELDMAANLLPEDVVRLQDSPDLEVILRDQQGQATVLYLNVEKAPLDDLTVRRAIEFAIDRDALSTSLFFDLLPPAYHVFTPDLWSYDAGLAELYQYDPAQAETLLDEAGWTRSGDGTRAKNGQELRLVWLVSQEQQPIAQFVQAQLREVGIAVELQTLAGSGLVEALTRGDHHLAGGTGGWVQEDPDVLRNWIHSSLIGVRQNYVRVRNPELDGLLEEGISFTGDLHAPEREQLYRRAQQIVMENAYVVPLYYRRGLEAYRPYVQLQNIGYDPYGTYHYWRDVWMDR